MWRFFVFPLIASIAVLIETSAGYFLNFTLPWLFSPLSTPDWPFMPDVFLPNALISSVDFTEEIWPYLTGAGLLLGLGIAISEAVRSKSPKNNLSWLLVQNVFWFGLYIPLLTTLPTCLLHYAAYTNLLTSNYDPLIADLSNIYFREADS